MARITGILLLLTVLTNWLYAQPSTRVISSEDLKSKEDIWNMLGIGVSNFEVDLMYIYGELFVTATMPDSANHTIPTFSDAYLFPLYSILKKNGNSIINGDSRESYILLNIHNDFKKTNFKLKSIVGPYKDLVTYKNGDIWHEGQIRFLIRDKNLQDEISKDGYSCIGWVGGKNDMESNLDSHQMPLIELNFEDITTWSGAGNIPFPDFVKIKELVNKIHQKGRRLSIINCPNHKTAWDVLVTSNVDFINTNDPVNVGNFINERKNNQ